MTYNMSTWVDVVRDVGVADVAAALAYDVIRNSVSPCPACGAERRGGADPRGPVGLRRDGGGWRCHRCAAHGDGVAFAAYAAAGAPLSSDNWKAVRDACAGAGLCPSGTQGLNGPTSGSFDSFRSFGHRVAVLAPPEAEPLRPPADEVEEVWTRALPVTDTRTTREWLRERGLRAADVEDLRLARALAPAGALPAWARSNAGTWRESGHALVLPLFDAGGALVSLRARCVFPVARPAKSLVPAGSAVAGLVLACSLTRLWLARTPLGDGRDPESEVRRVGLVITEGEPDFLSWATRWGVDSGVADAPAVLGVVAGAWSLEVAARVPTGTRVAVRTHADDAGNRYAREIAASIEHRCDLRRPVGGAA